jgi:CheY-like chemotaxis protein
VKSGSKPDTTYHRESQTSRNSGAVCVCSPRLLRHQKRVRPALLADGGARAMSRVDAGRIPKRKQHGSNRANQRGMIAARQIGSADRTGKQRIPDEQIVATLSLLADLEADSAGAMARGVMHSRLVVAERQDLPGRIELVHRRKWIDVKPEHRALFDGSLVQEEIGPVEVNRDAECALGGRDAGHVIDMGVGEQDRADRQGVPSCERQQRRHFITGIDQHGFARPLAGDDEAVLEEWSNRLCLDYHQGTHMILAIVDDLMFTSKIKATATQLGVPLTFARSSESALAEMRKNRPGLVILDLNSQRTQPLDTVAAMKSDPALADIPSVGFVSHVQTELIDAARKAGVGEVLARSAFTMQLPEILARGK